MTTVKSSKWAWFILEPTISSILLHFSEVFLTCVQILDTKQCKGGVVYYIQQGGQDCWSVRWLFTCTHNQKGDRGELVSASFILLMPSGTGLWHDTFKVMFHTSTNPIQEFPHEHVQKCVSCSIPEVDKLSVSLNDHSFPFTVLTLSNFLNYRKMKILSEPSSFLRQRQEPSPPSLPPSATHLGLWSVPAILNGHSQVSDIFSSVPLILIDLSPHTLSDMSYSFLKMCLFVCLCVYWCVS